MSFLDNFGSVVGAASDVNNLFQAFGARRRRKEAFAREDNAVQRRASDLEAAGLSKTLAAGSAAQSSAPPPLPAKVGAFADAEMKRKGGDLVKLQSETQRHVRDEAAAKATIAQNQAELMGPDMTVLRGSESNTYLTEAALMRAANERQEQEERMKRLRLGLPGDAATAGAVAPMHYLTEMKQSMSPENWRQYLKLMATLNLVNSGTNLRVPVIGK